jgi:hypothetical protein
MTAKTSVDSIHISLREVRGQDWSVERSQTREQTHLQRIHAPNPVECDAARDSGLDMEPSSPNVCTERGPSRNRQLGFKYNLPAITYWGSWHQLRKVHQQEDDIWGTTHSEQSPNGSAKKGRVWIPVCRSTCKSRSCNASSGISNPPAFLSQLMVMHSKIHKYRSDAIQAG